MIEYSVVGWADCVSECQHMWKRHYDEVERSTLKHEMDSDDGFYDALDKAGYLFAMVARCNSQTIGYAVFVIKRHQHANVIAAFEDRYYILPEHRGWAGINLIKSARKFLRDRGVEFMILTIPPGREKILQHIGFEHAGSVFTAWIGD